MKLNEYKTIKISPESHKIIKDYCNDNGLKMNRWIEKELLKIMKNINEKENN